MNNVAWIIDRFLLDYQVLSDFKQSFEDLNIPYYFTQYIPMSEENEEIPYSLEDKLVFYGTLGYLDNAKKTGYTGIYDLGDITLFDLFKNCPHLPLLNNNSKVYSIQDILDKSEQIFEDFSSNILFLRPVKDNKAFPGGLWTLDKIEHLKDRILNFSSRFVSVNDFIIAKIPDKIIKEFRFIIVNREVIAGSQYKLHNTQYISSDVTQSALELARMMANESWQPASCYTCDIAELSDGSVQIIELNGFSGAGWYACDKYKIIKAVTEFRNSLAS